MSTEAREVKLWIKTNLPGYEASLVQDDEKIIFYLHNRTSYLAKDDKVVHYNIWAPGIYEVFTLTPDPEMD